MSYVVLARKWRPQSFEDLVGQEHVSTTLSNAIESGRVAHAFLFTGVRGVGKTTSARILAKALNCAKGPTATPCQCCPACVEITAGSDVDVQEIDGASYNGVDEVRRLQETLPYRPARDRFKIFIVDEVHMLSNAAWNAFLKTLEEPPPHVKFIFATTEVHKVPVTILSRCQRYDFKLIGTQTIAARLRFVLDQEGVAADDAALLALAREAAGSMRDAMSLLDQVIAWIGGTGERLTPEVVAKVLGVAARSVLYDLARAVLGGDAPTCFRIVADLAGQGFDLPHVARDFLALLRDLVVVKLCPDPAGLLDVGDAEVADVRSLVANADADDLARLHQGFSRAFDDVVRSGQPRAAFEMALVRLARRPPLLPVDELLRRLGDLERRLGGSGAPSGTPSGAVSPGRGGGPGGGPARSGSRADFAPPEPSGPAGAFAGPPEMARAREPRRNGAEVPAASRASADADAVPRPRPPAPAADVAAFVAPSPPPFSVARAQPPPPAAAPIAVPVEPPPAAPARTRDIETWRTIVDSIRSARPAYASVLDHAAMLDIGPERVRLAYETGSFLLAQATDDGALALLRKAVEAELGAGVAVVIETVASRQGLITLAQIDAVERKARAEAARRAVAEHPLVTAAIELLGAELRDVRLGQDLDGG